MAVLFRTERLTICKFSFDFLEDYYRELTDEVTKYQFPDSFKSPDAAREVMSGFMEDMEDGRMLELVMLAPDGEFIGSMEAFGTDGETPEVGLWIKSSAHHMGYGYEALRGLIDYLNARKKYRYYIYEVDVRNLPSVRLVGKFHSEKGGSEEVTTGSGKTLKLQTYRVPAD